MFRFIHCADIHLDSPMRGLRFADEGVIETVRSATRRALENLISLAIRERVDFVIIAGDVFDGDWEDYSTGLFFNRCMQQLQLQSIPVYLIRGNHDATSVLTRNLTPPENVHILSEAKPETMLIEDLQVAIHGQSFAERDVTENLAAGYPQAVPGYFNLGILHTGLAGREGHARYAPCQLEDLLTLGYDYWALGHIHQPEVVHTAPPIVYAGNIQGRHIRETGERGCTLVTVDAGQVSMQRRPLDVLRWYEIVIPLSEETDESSVLAEVRSAISHTAADNAGVPLCLRVRLTDVAATHRFIHQDVMRFTHEVISSAQWAGVQPIYVERVILETHATTAGAGIHPGGTDALDQILRELAQSSHVSESLFTTISSWQRGIAARMQANDAPPEITAKDMARYLQRAMSEVVMQLGQGRGLEHGDS